VLVKLLWLDDSDGSEGSRIHLWHGPLERKEKKEKWAIRKKRKEKKRDVI
jgi:hypothetical protein